MIKNLLLLALFIACTFSVRSQYYTQDFDNGEIDPWMDTLHVVFDSASTLWQIGVPQKLLFDEASSPPNALITDTVNAYGASDTAVFYLHVPMDEEFMNYYYGIAAFKWVQKLDIDSLDGGTVDFSIDGGENWENAFTSPYVYNWYGWDDTNLDTLADGTIAFAGTDTLWREIWLCYEYGWLSTLEDTLSIRFTFFSDSLQGNGDGWMIDNLLLEPTIVHTVGESPGEQSYVTLYPNPVTERLNIKLKKSDEFHIIEELKIYSDMGRLMRSYEKIPTNFFVDMSDFPQGSYQVMIRSNLKTEMHQVVVAR